LIRWFAYLLDWLGRRLYFRSCLNRRECLRRFLGAGLIIKTDNHPHGVTTAALIWMAAAIGILVGVGLTQFAFAAAVVIALLLYLLRKLNISESLEKEVNGGK